MRFVTLAKKTDIPLFHSKMRKLRNFLDMFERSGEFGFFFH